MFSEKYSNMQGNLFIKYQHVKILHLLKVFDNHVQKGQATFVLNIFPITLTTRIKGI